MRCFTRFFQITSLTFSIPQFRLPEFQALKNHTWLATSTLGSAARRGEEQRKGWSYVWWWIPYLLWLHCPRTLPLLATVWGVLWESLRLHLVRVGVG